MATKPPEPPPKKKSTPFAQMVLDLVGKGIAEVAMPYPEGLIKALKGKKKIDPKKGKK